MAEINELKEKLVKVIEEQEQKMKNLIDKTHKAYEARYVELQTTI